MANSSMSTGIWPSRLAKLYLWSLSSSPKPSPTKLNVRTPTAYNRSNTSPIRITRTFSSTREKRWRKTSLLRPRSPQVTDWKSHRARPSLFPPVRLFARITIISTIGKITVSLQRKYSRSTTTTCWSSSLRSHVRTRHRLRGCIQIMTPAMPISSAHLKKAVPKEWSKDCTKSKGRPFRWRMEWRTMPKDSPHSKTRNKSTGLTYRLLSLDQVILSARALSNHSISQATDL